MELIMIETHIYFAHENHEFSAYRLVYFVGSVLTGFSFCVTFIFFSEMDVEEGMGIRDMTSN